MIVMFLFDLTGSSKAPLDPESTSDCSTRGFKITLERISRTIRFIISLRLVCICEENATAATQKNKTFNTRLIKCSQVSVKMYIESALDLDRYLVF